MTSSPPAARDLELDVAALRADFPILARRVHGKPLVYLDNAATAQKPRAVIDAVRTYYEEHNANIHRGVHQLSMEATDLYEGARAQVQRFLGAERPEEIIFLRGVTEAVNLVAGTFGRATIGAGDEIILSQLEHHSNIVPWQLLAESVGARIRVVPCNDAGELDLDAYADLFGPATKLVSIVHVSNAIGTINPAKTITAIAHERGVPVMFDGAQAAPHMPIDVRDIGCDFYAIAGHKMFGPTGIGALYGRFDILDTLPPYHGGGDMIRSVSFEGTTFNDLPNRLEAGTPNIAGAIGLGAAIEYLRGIGMERIAAREHALLEHGTRALADIPGLRLVGTAREKASLLSFLLDAAHPHDIGTILDQQGVAIRTGHHCTQPLMERFGIPATARASLAFYNTTDELDRLADGLRTVLEVFGP